MQPTADRYCVNCGAVSPPTVLSLEGFCQVCTLQLSDEAAREAWQRATPAERGKPDPSHSSDPSGSSGSSDARGAAVVARRIDAARAQGERLAWFVLGVKAGLALAVRAGLPIAREALSASVPALFRLLTRWGVSTPPAELVGTIGTPQTSMKTMKPMKPMRPEEALEWEVTFTSALEGQRPVDRPFMVRPIPWDRYDAPGQHTDAVVRQVAATHGVNLRYAWARRHGGAPSTWN